MFLYDSSYSFYSVIVASHFYTTQNLTIENQPIKNFESCYERDLSRDLEGHSCAAGMCSSRVRSNLQFP
jgi:hypothetical protein